MQRVKIRTLAWSLAVLVGSGAAVADSGLWLHVKVDEAGGAKVMVNLPINLVEKAVAMIPDEDWNDGRVMFDGRHQWTLADLRDLWNEVSATQDMTFVTVEDGDETVRVWKEAGYLKVHVIEHRGEGGEVNVQIPARVVDALLSGGGETFNFTAAVEALVDEGEGELVTVNDSNDRVRVWVDRIAEAK
jgi:riboflavin biosynthesis pyrimidine reductase